MATGRVERRSSDGETGRRRDETAAVGAPTCVLLAEDDDEMRRMLADALRNEGYAVREARDGYELLRQVRSTILEAENGTTVDLVITDVRLPGPSGLEVLQHLREREWAVPVIVITAFGDEALQRTARQCGATLVLNKPFEVGDLCAAASFLAAPR